MNSREKKDSSTLSLVEAVETLSTIADLELDQDMAIAETHDISLQDFNVHYRTVNWLHKLDADQTLVVVRDVFRVILNYLRDFYKKDFSHFKEPETIESIKTIMVLVGEAAKKLDKFTQLFHRSDFSSVTETKEYQQLQKFYLTKIDKKIDEGKMGKWVLAISQRNAVKPEKIRLQGAKKTDAKHVFVDLDSVKRDTEYELFYLRKEDGSRFFNPRLIRNIKLVSDFGDYFSERKGEDLLIRAPLWLDRCLHGAAKNIMRSIGPRVDRFYREAIKYKEQDLVSALNKAFMALMLCSTHHVAKSVPGKTCTQYFSDFQKFLREALFSREYQNYIAYPPEKTDKVGQCLLEVVHALCRAVFLHLNGLHEVQENIQKFYNEALKQFPPEHEKPSHFLWKGFQNDYNSMTRQMKRHPFGPLSKVLDVLQDTNGEGFDPYLLHNLPNQLYGIYNGDHKVSHVRMPSPTTQELINRAHVIEEFKGFLRYLSKDGTSRTHLLINLQDKTSWKEQARCTALENVENQDEFYGALIVVTLATNTDFYHQLAPYHQDNHADIFMEHFISHLQDEHTGFHFPEGIRNKVVAFAEGVLKAIHRIFFGNKNVLSREQRLDFIEIFYCFLQLKLLELTDAESFSFTSKDCLDDGAVASAQLFAFIKLLQPEKLSAADRDYLSFMLYAPSLLMRERVPLADCFHRFTGMLRAMEQAREEYGANFSRIIDEAFGAYFKTPLMASYLMIPKKTI